MTDDLIALLKAMPPENRALAVLMLDDEQAEAIDDRLDELFEDDTAEALAVAAKILETSHD